MGVKFVGTTEDNALGKGLPTSWRPIYLELNAGNEATALPMGKRRGSTEYVLRTSYFAHERNPRHYAASTLGVGQCFETPPNLVSMRLAGALAVRRDILVVRVLWYQTKYFVLVVTPCSRPSVASLP